MNLSGGSIATKFYNIGQNPGALGWVKWMYDWDMPGAEKEFHRAIQLNPGHALSHGMYALYLDSMGRFDEAFREFQIAREFDPVALGLIRSTAEHFRFMRQYDRAIAENRRVLDMDPTFENAHETLAYAYENKGMYDESINEMEQLAIYGGEHDLAQTMKTAYARDGYKGALKSRLKYYKDRRKAGAHVNFWDEALTNAQLGNTDLALQALEKADAISSAGRTSPFMFWGEKTTASSRSNFNDVSRVKGSERR